MSAEVAALIERLDRAHQEHVAKGSGWRESTLWGDARDALQNLLTTTEADAAYIRDADAALTDRIENPRDEYHSMSELYEYRLLYNAHAARGWIATGYPVVRSWKHHDGEDCFGGGYFIVTARLPAGQVSNHYKAENWDLFRFVPEVDVAPEWDGHTPAIAAERLRESILS